MRKRGTRRVAVRFITIEPGYRGTWNLLVVEGRCYEHREARRLGRTALLDALAELTLGHHPAALNPSARSEMKRRATVRERNRRRRKKK